MPDIVYTEADLRQFVLAIHNLPSVYRIREFSELAHQDRLILHTLLLATNVALPIAKDVREELAREIAFANMDVALTRRN